MPVEIVSGAQTGVDRGALDAALQAGVSCTYSVIAALLSKDE